MIDPVNLPNYFLADLPPEAVLSPAVITEACQTLKRNREHYLAHRTTHQLIEVLAEVARGWLQTDNRFRNLRAKTLIRRFSSPTRRLSLK